jgi:hypothetical protein
MPRPSGRIIIYIHANLGRAKLFEALERLAFRENTAAFKPQIFIFEKRIMSYAF